NFYRLLLQLVILAFIALGGAAVWLVHETSHPVANAYLVTPEKYGLLSSRGASVTDETWPNADGTTARGWLLRGTPGSPAVLLLHKYGADRSHTLNLGVKINEATNFTVLMPDLRGHGVQPAVDYTSFGACEASDASTAVAYLRGLKTADQFALVGNDVGIYGLEMGALAALSAAVKDVNIKALVLDSVPTDGDTLIAAAVDKRFPFASDVTSKIAAYGTTPYFYGKDCYNKEVSCEMAKMVMNRKVMLLAGLDEPNLQESTSRLSKCFVPGSVAEVKTDLSPSGYTIINASIDLATAYDQRVIDFFRQNLGPPPVDIQVASNTAN
ncbi:MAG TPA: alpha/beta hydrolase, partial [Pyrinomonadaceae bacterium]|nr:alpha/beta hydrolase [Pyrinomonadaceae bacterium]